MWKKIVKIDNVYDKINDTLERGYIVEAMMHLLEQEAKLNGNMTPYDAVKNALIFMIELNELSKESVFNMLNIASTDARFD